MKKLLLAVFSIATTFSLYAQREVPQERMEQIYEEVKTPYKYGLAVAPADNYHKIDCPTVFRQGDKWLMTYVVYNGKGGKPARMAVDTKPGLQKVIICSNGALWDGFFLIGMENGTAISVADFLHCRIWNGVEAMSFRLIKVAIG